jgi:hypothetical protein
LNNNTTTSNITYYITATIDLKFLHDFFAKLPLVKGAYMRMTFNTHCGSVATLNVSAPVQNAANGSIWDNPTSGLYNTVSVSSPNNVFPAQISVIGQGLPLAAHALGAGSVPVNANIRISVDIARVNSSIVGASGVASHPLNQCRLYACMYEFVPSVETRYLSSVATKKILYNDILSFQSLNTPAGGQVNQILSVGVSRVRGLLGVPFLSGSINGSMLPSDSIFRGFPAYAGTVSGQAVAYPAGQQSPFSVLSSPFSASPGSTSPCMRLSNFNVLLSGVNIYQENISYSFLEFQNEVRMSNALNGGLDLSLSSGGISQTDWNINCGYVYVDLSRRLSSADDNVARSLQVVYTNNSRVVMDCYWFIIFEREIQINTATGALVL